MSARPCFRPVEGISRRGRRCAARVVLTAGGSADCEEPHRPTCLCELQSGVSKTLSSTIQVSASVCSDPRLRCVSSTYASWLCSARGGSGPGIRIAASDRILRTALRSRNDARIYTLTRFDSLKEGNNGDGAGPSTLILWLSAIARPGQSGRDRRLDRDVIWIGVFGVI